MKRRWVLLLALATAAAASLLVSTEGPQRGARDAPVAFEVSRYNDALVYVHLRGGEIDFEAGAGLHAETGLPTTGEVHGVVLDRDGEPVCGALVVGGEGLIVLNDSLRARDGVRTDDDGRFTLKTYAEQEVSLVAMDHARGMSRAPRVGIGHEVELTLEPFAWLEGFVRDGDDAVEARIDVQTPDSMVTYVGRTDASGHYEIGPLPPGTYSVHARDDDPNTVIAFDVPQVELSAGTTTRRDIVESDLGSVAVEFVRPPGLRVAVVGVAVFEGPQPVHTDADYAAILQGEVDRPAYGNTSLGPTNPRKVFRGLPVGTYSACARLDLGDEGMHITCEPVTVDGLRTESVSLEVAAG